MVNQSPIDCFKHNCFKALKDTLMDSIAQSTVYVMDYQGGLQRKKERKKKKEEEEEASNISG